MNWLEYYSHIVIRKVRCNICRALFDEIDDVRVHLSESHNIDKKIVIIPCQVCKNPFVEIIKGQVRCSRQDCILYEDELVKSNRFAKSEKNGGENAKS